MYRIFILLPLFLLQATFANAYVNATIGAENSTSNSSGPSNTTLATPRTERHTCIYTVAELSTAGLTAGSSLFSIAWHKGAAGEYTANDMTFRVWLQHRSTTTFASNPSFAAETAGATLVYETTTGNMPATIGWLTYMFNMNAFTWNGTDNIQVITERIRPSSAVLSDFDWTTISTSSNAAANANSVAGPATLSRSSIRPQIRLEASSAGADASLESIPQPVSGTPGAQNINVVLRNTGNVTLTSLNFDWNINGSATTTYNWTGSLAIGAVTTVTIATPSFSNGFNTINVTANSPNGVADVFISNNTISKTIQTCAPLSGNSYTINSGAATGGNNFNNFTDFASTLRSCGVSGAVTATVTAASGPYTEQVVFQDIPGISAANTITIQGSGEIITSDTAILSTSSNPNRYIIRLVNMQNFTINNLKVNAVPGGTAWIGIHSMGSGNNITISNCSFDMGPVTSSLFAGIVFNDAPASVLTPGGAYSNLTFTGNTFSGGGYGISVVGLDAPGLATGVSIANNTFNNFNSNGVYLRETNGTVINGNNFNTTTSSGCNAIQYAQTNNINGQVSNNYISMSHTGAAGTHIGIFFNDGTGHKAFNNVIYNINNTGETTVGIQIGDANMGPELYNNTISMDNTGSSAASFYGIRFEAASTGSILRNNVISIQQPTSGNKAAIVQNNATALNTGISSNYNLFWVPGGNVFGTLSGTTFTAVHSNLAAWNTATAQDGNSMEVDPAFVSLTTPQPNNNAANDAGTPYGGLQFDIVNVMRGGTPDVGAYEFSGFPLSVKLGDFRGERKGADNVLYWTTYAETDNKGFDVERSADGSRFEPVQFVPSQASEGNSTQTIHYTTADHSPLQGDNYYRLKQIDHDGKITYSNIVLLKAGIADGAFAVTDIYPNPVKAALNLQLSAPEAGDVTIIITDLKGAVILQQQTTLGKGQSTYSINVAQLPAGVYMLNASHTKGSAKGIRFVKQ